MLTASNRIPVSRGIEPRFHPELRRAAFFIPQFSLGPASSGLIRALRKRCPLAKPPRLADISIYDEYIDQPGGESLRMRIYAPIPSLGPRPALLWMHGGGFVIGHPEQDQSRIIQLCRSLNIVVAAIAYRLGPDNPFPAPLDDCYAALAWLHENVGSLNIDRTRIAVGGVSAGGCLAAALALLSHDRRGPPIAFQLLIYPMLDDRTVVRADINERSLRMVGTGSNSFAWRAYLGDEPGGEDVSAYAAPSRRKDLSNLPPAWMGVGTCDLFLDECASYAARLNAAGNRCALKLVDGAFHAFDLVVPKSGVAADFHQSYVSALRAQLEV